MYIERFYCLTTADERMLVELGELTDNELDRLIAKVTVRDPFCLSYGWTDSKTVALPGCLIGSLFSREKWIELTSNGKRHHRLYELAEVVFPRWAHLAMEVLMREDYVYANGSDPLPDIVVDRLAKLLEHEYNRRHPIQCTPVAVRGVVSSF